MFDDHLPWKIWATNEGRRYFEMTCNVQLELRPIPAIIMQTFNTIQTKKRPLPPKKETKLAGKPYVIDSPNDPEHQARLRQFEMEYASSLIDFVLGQGVITKAPPEFDPNEWGLEIEDLTEAKRRALWIGTLLNEQEFTVVDADSEDGSRIVTEMEALFEAISSQTLPTSEAIEQAEATFQGDSKSA